MIDCVPQQEQLEVQAWVQGIPGRGVVKSYFFELAHHWDKNVTHAVFDLQDDVLAMNLRSAW